VKPDTAIRVAVEKVHATYAHTHHQSRLAQAHADAAQRNAARAFQRSDAAVARAHAALEWVAERHEARCRRDDEHATAVAALAVVVKKSA
jgi:hypothetical protein